MEDDDPLDAFMQGVHREAQQQVKQAQQAQQTAAGAGGPMSKKRAAERMHATLVEGMHTPLQPDNVGFRMLAAMGFKQGSGLGKAAAGRTEPVPVALRRDRAGLGGAPPSQTLGKRLRVETPTERVTRTRQHEARLMNGKLELRTRMSRGFNAKNLVREVLRAAQVARELDERAGLEHCTFRSSGRRARRPRPVDSEQSRPPQRRRFTEVDAAADWTPPPSPLPTPGLPESPRPAGDMEQAVAAREGVAAEGGGAEQQAAEAAAAGVAVAASTAAEAAEGASETDGDDAEDADEQLEELPEEELQARLWDLLTYLRQRHNYCLYCCSAFESQAELGRECPGLLEEDH